MTTIPYDAGWNVYVDGKKVETYSVLNESLLAFDIESVGTHDIEFRYMPRIYVITAIISAISMAIFVFLIVVDAKRKKKASISLSNKGEEQIEASKEVKTTETVQPQETVETEKTEGEN